MRYILRIWETCQKGQLKKYIRTPKISSKADMLGNQCVYSCTANIRDFYSERKIISWLCKSFFFNSNTRRVIFLSPMIYTILCYLQNAGSIFSQCAFLFNCSAGRPRQATPRQLTSSLLILIPLFIVT